MAGLGLSTAGAEEKHNAQSDQTVQAGTLHVPAFDLPPSELLSSTARAVLQRQEAEFKAVDKACPLSEDRNVVAERLCHDVHFYQPLIARYRSRYNVTIEPRMIGGVATEIIAPAEGVSATNRHRLLINLHGGSFMYGARWGGEAESIPIAAVGMVKVVSVNYRMAPEYQFPAASEDVAAVYKALLSEYKPGEIGIYGFSAGGLLTAEVVAWVLKEGLPRPGAIGLLGAGAFHGGGDSEPLGTAIFVARFPTLSTSAKKQVRGYITDTSLKDSLAFPGLDAKIMARFPDSLFITSTRDQSLSSAVATHAQLVKLGVNAELHVWEGLDHGFFLEPDLPESGEVYDVVTKFFDSHLAKAP
jgi:acetyl esterase/lipase